MKRHTICRLPALILVLASAAAVGPAHADTLQDAQRLLEQRQLAQALVKAEQLLAAKPQDAQARFLKGRVLAEMNRTDEAIGILAKLTEDFPELPEPYNNLAVLYAQQRQYEQAKDALEQALRANPGYAMAHENLGDVYARMAARAYDKALQLDASSATARAKLALLRDVFSTSAPSAAARGAAAQTGQDARAAQQASSGGSDGSRAAVTKMLMDWAAAWSRKDVDEYLSYYASDFEIPGNEARSAWERGRQRRIKQPGPLQVSIDDVRITMRNPDTAVVRFRQNYRAASQSASTNKVLLLTKRAGRWQIRQERVGG